MEHLIDELTKDDYQIAKANGIPHPVVYQRFYGLGWVRERAITEPVKRSLWGEYKEIAEAHGIGRWTFYTRVNKSKWDHMKAATYPVKGGIR